MSNRITSKVMYKGQDSEKALRAKVDAEKLLGKPFGGGHVVGVTKSGSLYHKTITVLAIIQL